MMHLAKARTARRILAIAAIALLACACIVLASRPCASQSRQSSQAFTSADDSGARELGQDSTGADDSETYELEPAAVSEEDSPTAQDEGGAQSPSPADRTSGPSSTMREKQELPAESLG